MRPLLRVQYWRQATNRHTFIRNMNSTTTTTEVLYALSVASGSKRPGPEDTSKLSHHAKTGFKNPWDSWRDITFKSAQDLIMRRVTGRANVPVTTGPTVRVRKPEFLHSRVTPNLRATWLGHACFYVEFPSGLRVLFDPVLEERCGPYNMLGPKRFTDAPCKPDDIPVIDAILISHNHYDHLSYKTLMTLSKKHPNCHFFVPLGVKAWFTSCGIKKVTELDWWAENEIKLSPVSSVQEQEAMSESTGDEVSKAEITARVSCLPCQHVSARTPFDRFETLWCSWGLESNGVKVYFAGDTGYRSVPELPDGEDDHDPKYDFPICPAFKQIGEFRGPFDLGLIPIGAYAPRHIWSPAHGDPHDAVNIFQDTKCKKALGMHWGAWVLTEEDVLEPPEKLKTALKTLGLPEKGVFDVCDIGESREF